MLFSNMGLMYTPHPTLIKKIKIGTRDSADDQDRFEAHGPTFIPMDSADKITERLHERTSSFS